MYQPTQEDRQQALKKDQQKAGFSEWEYLDNIPQATIKMAIELFIEGDSAQAGEVLAPHILEYADCRYDDLSEDGSI